MDLFTNTVGNHLVVQNSNASNSIKYYLLNSSGILIRSATIETSGGTEFPNISGDNDKVYIVYKLGSSLKFRKSTNAGISWTNAVNQDVGSNTCNGVDIVYNDDGLHVVYAMKDNGSYYETYYRIISSDTWGSREDVTSGSEVGGFPTIAVSSNRIHVGYNTGTNSDPFNNSDGYAKTRDKYITYWQNLQTVTEGVGSSSREKIQVRTDTLYDFYYHFDPEFIGFDLQVKSRDLNGTTWSSPTSIHAHCNPFQFMGVEQTANGELHAAYGDYQIYHRYYNGTIWSLVEYELTLVQAIHTTFGFTHVSNDLYCIWKERSNHNLKYAQYDATPIAPQNLTSFLDPDPPCNNCHGSGPGIRLDWAKNNEPDLSYYTIYRAERSCNSCHGSGGGTRQDSTTTVTEPITVHQECPAL